MTVISQCTESKNSHLAILESQRVMFLIAVIPVCYMFLNMGVTHFCIQLDNLDPGRLRRLRLSTRTSRYHQLVRLCKRLVMLETYTLMSVLHGRFLSKAVLLLKLLQRYRSFSHLFYEEKTKIVKISVLIFYN